MVCERKKLPMALVWQFFKSGVHHWPELQQTFFIPKIIHPTLQVQNEVAEYQYSDGPHGCVVPSEDDNFGFVFMISEQIWNFIDNNKIGNEKIWMLRDYEVLCVELVRFIFYEWLPEMRDLKRYYINGKADCYMENLGTK